jgi:hypothetical protein
MPESDESSSLPRRILVFTTVGVAIAALYTGWVFFSRWNDNQAAARARQEREAATARQTLDLLGGDELKILTFYPSASAIRRGQAATVCFGVSGAKSVRIEPEIEPIKPAISRCIQASPRKTTTYTLIAADGGGHTARQSFDLAVTP